MICSFHDADTEQIFRGEHNRKFQAVGATALRKLIQLNRAKTLADLRSPGNALEALRGNRQGRHSIRVNDQYRICFFWEDGVGAHGVELVEYH
jgi:proteic killer suppression protein